MELTNQNYYSNEANIAYMSVSQFKDFVPALGGCEARAMAKLEEEYEQPDKTAFFQGHYLHAWNEGKLNEFIEHNTDNVYTNKGTKRAEIKVIDDIIARMEDVPMVQAALSGKKEVTFTAKLFGVDWKIMIDSYCPEEGWFADLKGIKSLYDKVWNSELGCYENVFEAYGYLMQVAIYAEIERIANNRDTWLEPFLVVGTKETPPDIDIISFVSKERPLQDFIINQLDRVENFIYRVIDVKSGKVDPLRCGKCDYCRSTKILAKTHHYSFYDLY